MEKITKTKQPIWIRKMQEEVSNSEEDSFLSISRTHHPMTNLSKRNKLKNKKIMNKTLNSKK